MVWEELGGKMSIGMVWEELEVKAGMGVVGA